MSELVFVLEQTLGHVAHASNIRRALEQAGGSFPSTIIPIEYRKRSAITSRIPGVNTWSFDASRRARSLVEARLRQTDVSALFVHTQVAALLLGPVMKTVPTVVSLDATPRNFDSLADAYGHTTGSRAVEAIKNQINRSVFRQAAALVTWCRWAADSLVTDYGVPTGKIQVIHPGVDLGLFRPGTGGTSDAVRILFVGGDFERKGGPDLVEAVQRLGPGVELDVITGSTFTPPPGIVCRVHRGLRPQSPEILELYRRADIFALPSRGDCFPQAVAEGLASGLPVVATRVGAIPEMIDEGVNGHLVPAASPRELAAALEALVSSSSKRRQMGAASRLLAEREHDAQANNNRIFELLLTVSQAREARLRIA